MAHRKSPERKTTSRSYNTWIWYGMGIIILVGVILLIYQFMSVPETETPYTEPPLALEGEAALDKITELNEDDILPVNEDWEQPLLEGDYNDARRKLESLLSNTMEMSEFTRHAYFLGLLYLYAPEDQRNLQRAIQYLKFGRQYRSDASLYLVKAYLESGQVEEARKLVQDEPQLRKQLPESLLEQL